MATLVFSAIGTALGGPLGGALGALIGNQIDKTVIGSPKREGPRLKELAISTSSYGTAIPRHFGRVRAPGSIIWSTNLAETKEKSGGGKGKPSVTTYNYSVSFAIAVASRPIKSIGRIWADGNLLRGSAGDLKVGGELRIYNGHGDQPCDPLIAAAQGGVCPAFRGLAYCVFEDLQLSDFGNRVPGLTLEVIADDGEVSLEALANAGGSTITIGRELAGLQGFSDEGGSLIGSLSSLDQLYPMACDATSKSISLESSDTLPENIITLPMPVADPQADSFGATTGQTRRRQPDAQEIPDGLRYYDVERDYQPGLQRADGRARTGRSRVVEFPGALASGPARQLANAAAERSSWARETLSWRIAEIDPGLTPGQIVAVPGHAGYWRVEGWEWCTSGLELDLRRLPPGPGRRPIADSGSALPAPDKLAMPTQLLAFEIPWDGEGSASDERIYAAPSSATSGWTGAALYEELDGALNYLQASGKQRSVIGALSTPLKSASSALLDRSGVLEVQLVSADFVLYDATIAQVTGGRNRALISGEIIQFAIAERQSGGLWRLSGLLRGRGGTENAAAGGHATGAPFVLLDGAPVLLEVPAIGFAPASSIAAIGLADKNPALAPLINRGLGRRPIHPVHPRVKQSIEGEVTLSWTRRARGAWTWADGQETRLNEEAERYEIGLGSTLEPALRWQTAAAELTLTAPVMTELQAEHSGKTFWVRQIGTFAASPPLALLTLP